MKSIGMVLIPQTGQQAIMNLEKNKKWLRFWEKIKCH